MSENNQGNQQVPSYKENPEWIAKILPFKDTKEWALVRAERVAQADAISKALRRYVDDPTATIIFSIESPFAESSINTQVAYAAKDAGVNLDDEGFEAAKVVAQYRKKREEEQKERVEAQLPPLPLDYDADREDLHIFATTAPFNEKIRKADPFDASILRLGMILKALCVDISIQKEMGKTDYCLHVGLTGWAHKETEVNGKEREDIKVLSMPPTGESFLDAINFLTNSLNYLARGERQKAKNAAQRLVDKLSGFAEAFGLDIDELEPRHVEARDESNG